GHGRWHKAPQGHQPAATALTTKSDFGPGLGRRRTHSMQTARRFFTIITVALAALPFALLGPAGPALATVPVSLGSDAADLTNIGGTLFFAANDGLKGFELFKSDGTALGTKRVKDINP